MKWFTVLAAIRRSPNGFGLDRGNTGSLFALDLSSGVQTPLASGVGFPKTFGFADGYGNVVWCGRTARTSLPDRARFAGFVVPMPVSPHPFARFRPTGIDFGILVAMGERDVFCPISAGGPMQLPDCR